MLVGYDSDDSSDSKKKKKKKSKKKAREEEASLSPQSVDVPPKVVLPSATDLLGESKSKAQFLQSNTDADVETFISTLNEGDLVLQVSKPRNSVTSKIEDKERRTQALKMTRAKMDASLEQLAEHKERSKLESWKRVKFERKDKDGNVIKPPPVDPRGKSIHKLH